MNYQNELLERVTIVIIDFNIKYVYETVSKYHVFFRI